jgi:hypothetical protein
MKYFSIFLFLVCLAAGLFSSCAFWDAQSLQLVFPETPDGWLPEAQWEWQAFSAVSRDYGVEGRSSESATSRMDSLGNLLITARLVDADMGIESSWAYCWAWPKSDQREIILQWDRWDVIPGVLHLVEEGFPWYRLRPEAFSLALEVLGDQYAHSMVWASEWLRAPESEPELLGYDPLVWEDLAGNGPMNLTHSSLGFAPDWEKVKTRGVPQGDWYAWGDEGYFRCRVHQGKLLCFPMLP